MTSRSSPRIIDRNELRKLVPYSLTHIGRLEAQGNFPRRLRIGANRVGWLLSEIEDWIEERVRARDGREAPTT